MVSQAFQERFLHTEPGVISERRWVWAPPKKVFAFILNLSSISFSRISHMVQQPQNRSRTGRQPMSNITVHWVPMTVSLSF